MIMKSLLTCLAVLTLSLNVAAIEAQEEPRIITPNRISLSQANSPDTLSAIHIVNSHAIPQASAEKPSEFVTAL